MTTCGSCGVGRNHYDEFCIAGAYNLKLQIMVLKENDWSYRDDIQVSLPATYVNTDWYFATAQSEKNGNSNSYYSAIARKTGDTTKVILFYVQNNNGSGFTD